MCITCENAATTECGICNQLVYCDNASCQSIGWSAHQCNIVEVGEPNMTVFLPYVGEDMMDEEMLSNVSDELYQSYVLRYVDPKGAIQQRLVGGEAKFEARGPKLGRGPDSIVQQVQNASYHITVEVSKDAFSNSIETVVFGKDPKKPQKIEGQPEQEILTIGEDSIWKGAPGVAGKLARNNVVRSLMSNGASYVLWPNPGRIRNVLSQSPLNIPVNGGSIKLTAFVNGMQVAQIQGIYNFGKGLFKRRLRRLNPFQTEFKNKFKQGQITDAALENLEALRATDNDGTAAQLIFEVTRTRDEKQVTSVSLMDIEMQVPLRAVNDVVTKGAIEDLTIRPKYESTSFKCDPHNLDHVTGLVMALEDRMAAGDLSGPLIQQQFDIINTHRTLLETHGSAEVSPKINAAVQGATQSLWQLVGLKNNQAFDQKYYDAHKNDSYAALKAEVDNLKVGGEGNKFVRKILGKRGKEKGRVRAIQKIVTERSAAIEANMTHDAAMKDTMYKLYSEMLSQLAGML